MKIIALIPFSSLALFLPLVTAMLNERSWLWIYVSLPAAIWVAVFLISILRVIKRKTKPVSPVENENMFDHLFLVKNAGQHQTLRSPVTKKHFTPIKLKKHER